MRKDLDGSEIHINLNKCRVGYGCRAPKNQNIWSCHILLKQCLSLDPSIAQFAVDLLYYKVN